MTTEKNSMMDDSMGPPNTELWESAKLLQKQISMDDLDQLTLTDLPSELLIHICSFLQANFVHDTLSKVSVLFQQLILNDTFWKVRIGKSLRQKYPPIAVRDADFCWISSCIQLEHESSLWSDSAHAMEHHTCPLYTSVDCVKLLSANSDLLIAGCRDRCFYMFDLSKINADITPENAREKLLVTTMINAHKGWVWCLDSYDSTFVTGSWDQTVKFWDAEVNTEVKGRMDCRSPVLCMHMESEQLFTGMHNKSVLHIDHRAKNIVDAKTYHKGAVLRLQADDKYLVTASEDKTVVVYDRRAGRTYKTIKFDHEPYSLSYNCNQLWVGDKLGKLHLIDTSDGDFDLIDTYDVGHAGKLTGIVHNPGALITCSTDRTIQVAHPTNAPQNITILNQQNGEMTRIDYKDDKLVAGNARGAVEIWKPKCT